MNYIIIFIILFLIYMLYRNITIIKENFDNDLLGSKYGHPYRYFKDETGDVLPIVAITAFFRSDKDKEQYYKFINAGIKVIGVTAYKTFPVKITDPSEDKYHINDNFDYLENIKVWLTCMRDIKQYNFNETHNTIEMSESDFYDVETNSTKDKKYDFIYVCGKDHGKCPLNGWNAINRNYNLALKCFPIMVNEYKLKGLCVGRIDCDLSEYGDSIETTDFLPWTTLQEKMRESKFLFVPNIYDASPRVVAECIIKDVPVLMNNNIVCGFKYINNETGEFFIDENNIRNALDNLLGRIDKMKPSSWWNQHYGVDKCSIILRDFLYKFYPDILENVKKVSMVI
jgi:hypothetical protein